ncbi:MAG: HlyD family type I secretion periplasmic adaptor subunit [Desulfuromonadales bacterium]
MNTKTEHDSTTTMVEHVEAKTGEIAHQSNSPAKRNVTALTPRKVQSVSSDSQLRSRAMSALPATLVGLGILGLFVGGIALWIIYVPLSAVVSAPAEVVFKGKRQTVQHLEGGIIEKILIKDGDMVQSGQALIVLEDKQVKPIVRMAQEQNVAERAQMSRLEAESRDLKFLDIGAKGVGNKHVQAESRLFKARQESFQNQVELIRIQISQIKESLRGSEERLALKSQETDSIKTQLEANQRLLKDGYVSKSIVLDLRRSLAANAGELESIRTAIAGDKQRIAEFEQRIITLKSDRIQGAVSELKQSTLRGFDQEERIRPLRDTLERQVIRAPVTGRVVGLKVSTVGGTIMPREQLMEIAPVAEMLILEAKIDMKDINEVKVGQVADVSISSFDGRKTMPLRAKVTYISDDRIAPTSSQGQPYYAAHLEFESDSFKNQGDNKLISGMSANVSIAIAPRASLDYLIAPMREKARKALQIR